MNAIGTSSVHPGKYTLEKNIGEVNSRNWYGIQKHSGLRCDIMGRGMAMEVQLALLTGGSSGIGLAVATELVKNGASVILVARREELLSKAKAELERITTRNSLRARIHILSLDVSDADEVDRIIPPLIDEIGTPDLCYIGAGIAHPDHFEKISQEIFQRTMDVNVGGAWNVLSAVVPRMKNKKGGATIIIVSSLAGLVGTYGYSAYAASKFALVGLSQCLRNELKPEGIDVKVLCPQDTDTPQLAAENETKPDETRRISRNAAVMSPQTVAKALLKALGKKKFLIIPGTTGRMGWFVYRLFPRLVYGMFDREVSYIRKRKAAT